MSESEHVVVFPCRSCEAQVVGVQVAYAGVDDRVLTVETRCPICERTLGISIDMGTLDLGIVRDSQLEDRFDFEVFA